RRTSVYFFSSRRLHTRSKRDWSSDVCSSDLHRPVRTPRPAPGRPPRLGHAHLQLRPHRGTQLPHRQRPVLAGGIPHRRSARGRGRLDDLPRDRKSTRLNSSHVSISYAVFCLKKKTHVQTNKQSDTTL